MDRRDFLRKSLVTVAGTAAMFWSPNLINDEFLYFPKELFSTDLYSLEKIIMAGKILTEENPESLINLYNEVNQKPHINIETERIKSEIKEILINKIRQFSRKTPSREKVCEARDEIDQKYQKIKQIKEDEKITFVNFKREIFVSSQEDLLKPGDSALKEFYKFDNYISLLDSLIRNGEANLRVLYMTLVNLSPNSLLISEASNISGIPMEEIVAFANLESTGRPFAIGRDGEINTFQLNTRYLTDIYKNALSRKNLLSDYIQENTSKRTLLEDLVGNSRLNIAVAVNLMKYLKEETETYYEYVLAYNRGLERALDLPQRVRRKLENPERISEKDKKKSVFRYYTSFLNTKRAFEQMRNHVTRRI